MLQHELRSQLSETLVQVYLKSSGLLRWYQKSRLFSSYRCSISAAAFINLRCISAGRNFPLTMKKGVLFIPIFLIHHLCVSSINFWFLQYLISYYRVCHALLPHTPLQCLEQKMYFTLFSASLLVGRKKIYLVTSVFA